MIMVKKLSKLQGVKRRMEQGMRVVKKTKQIVMRKKGE